jgi:hypothetical protein
VKFNFSQTQVKNSASQFKLTLQPGNKRGGALRRWRRELTSQARRQAWTSRSGPKIFRL